MAPFTPLRNGWENTCMNEAKIGEELCCCKSICCRIPYQEDFLLPFFCSPSTLPLYFWPKYLEGEEGGSIHLEKRVGPKAPSHQRGKEGRGRGYKRHEAPSTGREERGGKGTRPPQKKGKGLTEYCDPRFIPTRTI